ncbi:MAG TPA: Ig-like domain-containing protein [Actinomycetota bacterium]
MSRRSAGLLAGVLVAMSLVVAIPTPAQAAWTAPSLVRSIGGRGEPGVYAWGIQYNPVSNEIVVGDYLNYQIRRYALDGTYLGSFYRTGSAGQPYSISIDPRNGNIIVPELRDGGPQGVIAIYDKTGVFLKTITVRAQYWVWTTTDDKGSLYIIDSHYWASSTNPSEIYKYSLDTGSLASGWPKALSYGTGAGKAGRCYGIGVDWSTGNIYVSDSTNKNVHVYSASGSWLRDIGGGGEAVGQFKSDLRGVAIDQTRDLLYVNDADAGQVEQFDIAPSTPVALRTWGSIGAGAGQFADGGRQLTVTPDGDVWDADYGNWRFQRFTNHGILKGIYPDPAQPAAPGHFAQPRGVAADPATGDVFVADTWNERVQKFDAAGRLVGAWGLRSSLAPYGFDYPRGIGFDPGTNRVWVTNTRAHNIRRYAADMSYVDTLGSELRDSSSPGSFRWPVNVDFYGGKAYVADYNSGVIKVLDAATGQELQQRQISNNAVAVDPATGNVYVLSWSNDRVTVFDPSLSSTIRTFGSSGTGNGQFRNPWGMTIVNGLVYITDTQLSRVQAFDLNGAFVGKWGGFGTGPYQFDNPSGIAHDAAGRLYIADAGNDRIQVYSTTAARPTGDTRKPTVTIGSPTAGQQVPGGMVAIGGTATDNAGFGVAKVDVAVQDVATGLWWVSKNATWSTTKTWNQAAVAGTSITSMTFTYPFVGATYGRSYHAEARATDVSSITSGTNATVAFTTGGSPGDGLPPQTAVTAPAFDAVLPAGAVTIAGNAGDNVGVAGVDLAIQDRNTLRWFNPSTGSFATQPTWFPAGLAAPGAVETTWNYPFTGSAAGTGSYTAIARGRDAAGNVETDAPFTRFTVQGGSSDTTPPETTIALANNQVLPLGPITFSGTASDDVGVANVQVAIRNRTSLQYWNGTSWVTPVTWLNGAALGTPGGATTTWSFGWTPAATGPYAVTVRALDGVGNIDPTRPWVNFSVA